MSSEDKTSPKGEVSNDPLVDDLNNLDAVKSVSRKSVNGEEWLYVTLTNPVITPALSRVVGAYDRDMIPQEDGLLVEGFDGVTIHMELPEMVWDDLRSGKLREVVERVLSGEATDAEELEMYKRIMNSDEDVDSIPEAHEWLENTRDVIRILEEATER